MGKQVALDGDKGVSFKYVYDEKTKSTAQTLSVDGAVVSSITLGMLDILAITQASPGVETNENWRLTQISTSIRKSKGMGHGSRVSSGL
jgi:hypothetical protein